MVYISQVSVDLTPSSSYTLTANAISSLDIKWNYPTCQKNWFRVAGVCFQPPPKDGCPPYPNPGAVPADCVVNEFNLTNLFNSGLDDNHNLIVGCLEDRHNIVLPSQYPFVVAASTLPPGLTLPTASSQYVGLSCNGSAPADSSYTFRFFFVCPNNVAPSTLEIESIFDSPNQLLSIVINGENTGLSSSAPLINKTFLLTGNFQSDVNFIDVSLKASDSGYLALMARFSKSRACTSNGNFPPGVNTGCQVNLTTNVFACDPEDVCRILKNRGLIFPIKSIRKVTSTSLDYNCYTDVTPTLQDCVECCDFLVDENLEDSWGMACGAIEYFQYTSNFAFKFASASSSRMVFKYSSKVNINFEFESDQDTSYNAINSNFRLEFAPKSILRRGFWSTSTNPIILFDSEVNYASSIWMYDPIIDISFTPKSTATPKTKIKNSTKVSFSPRSTYKSLNYYISKFYPEFDPDSFYDVDGYLYIGQVKASLSSHVNPVSSAWKYTSKLSFSSVFKHRNEWHAITSTTLLFGPRSVYTVSYLADTAPSITFGPRSVVVVATVWGWINDVNVNLHSLTDYTCSDLGTLEMDFYGDSEATELPVRFQDVSAPPLPVNNSSLSLPGCCPSIPERLQFRHNLGSIFRLNAFLNRNGLSLPGQLTKGTSVNFIPVNYSSLQGQWTGSLYLAGLSPFESGTESWNLTVEFGCGTNWRVAIRLYRRSVSSDESFRLIANYPSTTVCPTSNGFQGFAAAISATNVISVPSASSLVINDEEDFIQSSATVILVQFSVETSGSQITFPVNLENQLKAASAALL